MTPSTMPLAELLDKAADKLERRADAVPSMGGMHGIEGSTEWCDWLDLFMDPDEVAPPLVRWLRDTASDLRDEPVQTSCQAYALAFARSILGEEAS